MAGEKIGNKLFDGLIGKIKQTKAGKITLTGAGENMGAFIINRLAAELNGPEFSNYQVFLIVTPCQDSAERACYQIETLMKSRLSASARNGSQAPDYKVCLFSSLEWSAYEFLSPSQNLMSDRISTLKSVVDYGGAAAGKNKGPTPKKLFIVAPVTGLMQKCGPYTAIENAGIKISKNDTLDIEKLVNCLSEAGYTAEDPVIDLAQFAVRGGILDIFVPGHRNPVRLDFFGDTVDSIKTFNIEDQRAIEQISEVYVLPASEYIFGKKEIESMYANMNKISRVPQSHEAGQIADGVRVANIERYAPFMYDYSMPTLVDYLNKYVHKYCVFYYSKEDAVNEGAEFLKKVEKLYEENKAEDIYSLAPDHYYKHPDIIIKDIEHNNATVKIDMSAYDAIDLKEPGHLIFDFNVSALPRFQGKFNQFMSKVGELIERANTVVMMLPTAGQIGRMVEVLSSMKLAVVVNDDFLSSPPARKTVYVNEGYLHEGFIYNDENIAFFSSYEAYGEHQPIYDKQVELDVKAKAKNRYRKISSHLELSDGDYVVHVNYGIGVYRGITLLSAGGREADYLLLEYADTDKLYVPVDALSMLHKYIALDGAEPKIGKLDESSWKRQKATARKSIEKLAAYLVTLYARRSIAQGHKFNLDNDLMRQFEESFPYKETSDQQNSIIEVKCDMESEKPMDRLICGDVGFGKTEVAIRAAFKACMDGKQVAFLAPTTILAMQHYNTLTSRFASYPVTVELLSRFRSKAEQKETVEKLKEGKVDVVVGTHRIIQKDMGFKDLGLLIVDEEQRFGVKHKERLKELKNHVDVLTLTATPIPRTLYMSLVGSRDISTINTPPAERLPVKTFVLRYSEDVVREAMTRELMRRGQVYYVHNRIDTISSVVSKISALVPGARVRFAHGQMDEKQLEKIMVDFYDREFDVLVSTTIIENGLDISNVNTIIIERADTFGLSQLYQLRGRVGRAKNQAYAYFFFPHESILSHIAKKRLQAMKEFSELGSGYKIAMRDLEIRGAGNLLGHEQHGHICTIGFELYCRLLEEEIKKIKGESIDQKVESDCEIEINTNAYIPTNYITSTYQKIDVYKRMVAAAGFEELSELNDELIDRFGKYPEQVYNLFQIVKIKILGRALKAISVKEEKKHIIIKFQNAGQIEPASVETLRKKFGSSVSFAHEEEITILYLVKADMKGDNLVQTIISALKLLSSSGVSDSKK